MGFAALTVEKNGEKSGKRQLFQRSVIAGKLKERITLLEDDELAFRQRRVGSISQRRLELAGFSSQLRCSLEAVPHGTASH